MSDTSQNSPGATHSGVSTIQPPPRTLGGILLRLGPGWIIAGSIVGSGELIATTKTGADAGIWLLWLIIVGCVIKVFVQVEFGRFTITEGRTTMDGMNLVPGPRWRVNWLMWYWLFMFTVGFGQLGGIVGGVGQALSLSIPITNDVNQLREDQDSYQEETRRLRTRLLDAEIRAAGLEPSTQPNQLDDATRARVDKAVEDELGPLPDYYTWDDVIYSGLIALITAAVLFNGRYGLVQTLSIVLVTAFTLLTIFNFIALQSYSAWAVSWSELVDGFRFRLPPASTIGKDPLVTALAAFGIIGVGASELVAYPYWCLEKGYARFTGPRGPDDSWAERARGWLHVMRWDAWCSMVIYTFATVAFYLLGASVLHRQGVSPDGMRMISTLAEMYGPVFGQWASAIFLFGAFAVLYSTFFVATAGNARMGTDALRVYGLISSDDAVRRRWIRIFCAIFPLLSFAAYALVKKPVIMVLISGMAQSIMLPMLGGAGLYFRYRHCDRRITPGRLWDLFLWVSVGGLLLAGCYGASGSLSKLFSG
jgi:Mn2+/Fe2+ NRAMP family transporter